MKAAGCRTSSNDFKLRARTASLPTMSMWFQMPCSIEKSSSDDIFSASAKQVSHASEKNSVEHVYLLQQTASAPTLTALPAADSC